MPLTLYEIKFYKHIIKLIVISHTFTFFEFGEYNKWVYPLKAQI